MKRRSRKSFITGLALLAIAFLVMVIAVLYISFAPKVFSARAIVRIASAPPQARPLRLGELPLQWFARERDLVFEQVPGNSLINVSAFAPEPEKAATRANESARELGALVRSQLNADFLIISVAEPSPRPVRPAKQKILSIAALISMNLGIAGVTCLLVGFLKGRRHLPLGEAPMQATT